MDFNKFQDICKEEVTKYFNNRSDKTDKFELKKNFLCDGYKYKVHDEITHEIYNYLKYSC